MACHPASMGLALALLGLSSSSSPSHFWQVYGWPPLGKISETPEFFTIWTMRGAKSLLHSVFKCRLLHNCFHLTQPIFESHFWASSKYHQVKSIQCCHIHITSFKDSNRYFEIELHSIVILTTWSAHVIRHKSKTECLNASSTYGAQDSFHIAPVEILKIRGWLE